MANTVAPPVDQAQDPAPYPTPYPEGTLVRVLPHDPLDWDKARVESEFIVEDYVSAEEADDGIAFYWGSNNGGMNNVTCPASAVQLVKTAAEMAARRPPTPEAVARHLNAMGDHEVFDVDETEPDGNSVLLVGTTPDGLRIVVRLVVAEVYEVDY